MILKTDDMTERPKLSWGIIAVIIGFVVYEAVTAIFQLLFLIRGDLMEVTFDILFILLLIFFYDVDAIILTIELVPFIDIIPFFVIYILFKVSNPQIKRRPLIAMDWNFWKHLKRERRPSRNSDWSRPQSRVLSSEEKVIIADSSEEVCVICMRPLQDGEEVITCVNGHFVHVDHIQPWTESLDRDICPVCRVKYPKVLISKTYLKQ
ncbi:MAG TPA: RING-H2 finger protein [Candidatus Deferrimicrobium sp.]|nr:RING-H2 finger protein [Candidatus Deferrimicrobium sp.]